MTRPFSHSVVPWSLLAFLMAPAGDLAAEPSFRTLDFFPTAISADGNVVVGGSDDDGAIRWTIGGERRSIGALPGDDRSWAWAVSADGAVIAGESGSSADLHSQAFRWTENDGMSGLGMLVGDSYSIARGIAADGSIIVGESGTTRAREGWKWTLSGGLVGLGPVTTSARDISADGRIIVGAGVWRRGGSADIGLPPPARQQIFYQGVDGVITELPMNAGEDFPRLTSDGTLVLLQAGSIAGKWSPSTFSYLGALVDDHSNYPTAVSADGRFVVGNSLRYTLICDPEDYMCEFGVFLTDFRPFIWDGDEGIRSLQDVLLDNGVDTRDWKQMKATGISGNGLVIVGTGIDASDAAVGWMATIPEPGWLACLAFITFFKFRSRGHRLGNK